ncbi:translation initiation factor eIF-2B [Patescibacteria group bacterium]|nr:translation initiation factor eIF-2B [Patescibacteria group bacterium]MBU1890638.1 translation initiation factor eIF-2B [Patescibacteria group bacterium]
MNKKSLDKTIWEINSVKYQGATNIAQAALKSFYKYSASYKNPNQSIWLEEMKSTAKYIVDNTRPNEPLARNGLKYILNRVKDNPNQSALKQSLSEFIALINQAREKITKSGKAVINSGDNIYTHCHSSTVEKLLVNTYVRKKFNVYNSETRPLFQGRITATRLRARHIPVTMVVDAAVPFLISTTSGRDLMMDKVIIGADVIQPDGTIINKIGSYGIALAAYENKVPVYIAANLLKYSNNLKTKLERRPAKEVWPKAPRGMEIINFAFDKIPAKYITRIICEFGLIKPTEVKRYLSKHYPWII